MEYIVLLVLAGYAVYGLYLLLLHYGYIIVPCVLGLWLVPRALKLCGKGVDIYDRRLYAHKKAEKSQRDLFTRFSGKRRYLFVFHRLILVFAGLSIIAAAQAMPYIREIAREQDWRYMIPREYRFLQEPFFGVVFCLMAWALYCISLKIFNALPLKMKLFPSYNAMAIYANKTRYPHTALEQAYALRECAAHHITGLYDFFVAIEAVFAKEKETPFYKSHRLHQTLTYLEKHFPHTHEDEEFRRRYWNYARHIFALLHFRGSTLTENSFFALPYPETEKIKEQETQNAIKNEREKFQNQPLDVWSKSPDEITIEDALEIIGLADIPSVKLLHKLHKAVLEEHKADPKKAKTCAKAFEILGREAVLKELSGL